MPYNYWLYYKCCTLLELDENSVLYYSICSFWSMYCTLTTFDVGTFSCHGLCYSIVGFNVCGEEEIFKAG